MRMRSYALLLMLFWGAAAPGGAQAPAAMGESFRPSAEIPNGVELIAYFIGASTCPHSNRADVIEAMNAAKPLLARQATNAGRAFSVTGVAAEWDVEAGLRYLAKLGALSQVSAGGNWVNDAAVATIWNLPDAPAATPQVVILERVVTPGARRIEITPPRVLSRIVGPDSIRAWVARGALINAKAPQ